MNNIKCLIIPILKTLNFAALSACNLLKHKLSFIDVEISSKKSKFWISLIWKLCQWVCNGLMLIIAFKKLNIYFMTFESIHLNMRYRFCFNVHFTGGKIIPITEIIYKLNFLHFSIQLIFKYFKGFSIVFTWK